MDYNKFFKQIEKSFFSDDYKSVIELWENNQNRIVIDYTKEFDDKILEAVKVSYNEIDIKSKSLFYIDEQFRLLPRLNISLEEKEKKLKYYFNDKIHVLLQLNKPIEYYQLLRQYMLLWANVEDKKRISNMEIAFYNRFIRFNNYFFLFLILLVTLSFLSEFLDYNIDSNVVLIYDIVTYSAMAWVVFLYLFRKKVQGWFVILFRYLFKPKGNFEVDFLFELIGKEKPAKQT